MGKLAQLMNVFILCKYEDLSLDPTNPYKKSSVVVHTYDPSDDKMGGGDRWISGILWALYPGLCVKVLGQ